MGDWTRGEILAVVGTAVAVLAVIAGIVATRRYGTRRGRLLLSYRSTPLLPADVSTGPLKVTYHDIEVPDPHLLTLQLKNVGPRDITSAHFDGGKPLRIDLNCTLYGRIRYSPVVTSGVGGPGFVYFGPALLRRGEGMVVDMVTEGQAVPTIDSPLIDIDVVEGEAFGTIVLRELARSALPGLGLPVLTIGILDKLLERQERQQRDH